MRRITRLLTVFALAGAALSLTGCVRIHSFGYRSHSYHGGFYGSKHKGHGHHYGGHYGYKGGHYGGHHGGHYNPCR